MHDETQGQNLKKEIQDQAVDKSLAQSNSDT